MSDNAAQYQYGTSTPYPPDLPYTGADVMPMIGLGALLFFVGVCGWTLLKDRFKRTS